MSESGSDDPQPLDYANPRNQGPWGRFWALLLILVFATAIGLWLAIRFFSPSLSYPHAAFAQNKTASNLRKIGQGLLLYTADHNGEYPDSFSTIFLNEDMTSDMFVSPFRSETPANGPTTRAVVSQLNLGGGHVSYVYLGKGLSMRTVTPDIVVAYELLLNPGTGTNMLFSDGHVEYISPATTAKIIATASAGQFPVTMPSQ